MTFIAFNIITSTLMCMLQIGVGASLLVNLKKWTPLNIALSSFILSIELFGLIFATSSLQVYFTSTNVSIVIISAYLLPAAMLAGSTIFIPRFTRYITIFFGATMGIKVIMSVFPVDLLPYAARLSVMIILPAVAVALGWFFKNPTWAITSALGGSSLVLFGIDEVLSFGFTLRKDLLVFPNAKEKLGKSVVNEAMVIILALLVYLIAAARVALLLHKRGVGAKVFDSFSALDRYENKTVSTTQRSTPFRQCGYSPDNAAPCNVFV